MAASENKSKIELYPSIKEVLVSTKLAGEIVYIQLVRNPVKWALEKPLRGVAYVSLTGALVTGAVYEYTNSFPTISAITSPIRNWGYASGKQTETPIPLNLPRVISSPQPVKQGENIKYDQEGFPITPPILVPAINRPDRQPLVLKK